MLALAKEINETGACACESGVHDQRLNSNGPSSIDYAPTEKLTTMNINVQKKRKESNVKTLLLLQEYVSRKSIAV